MATSAEINSIITLYIGYFGRAPDPAGLQAWITEFDAGRVTIADIAGYFADSSEAKALYPFLDTPAVSDPSVFVTAVYQNLFGRAPDAAGLEFWTTQLANKTVSSGEMILSIINGAVDAPDATPPSFDAAVLANRIEAALDFVTDAANTPGFVYDDAAAAAAKAAVDGVTNDSATVDAAKAATDAFLGGTGGGIPGSTLTLTTKIDNITGTENNDTIRAIDASSLASPDVIDGGAGIDTLNISVGGQAVGSTPVIKNVEIVNDSDTNASDLTSVSGVQQYWSTAGNTINNADLSTIFGTKGAGGVINVDFLASTAGKADTLKIAAMDNTNTTTFSSADSGSIEKVEIAARGGTDGKDGGAGTAADDYVYLTGFTALTSIKVTGAGDIEVATGQAVASLIDTIDTTGATGFVEVDASGSTKAITATGGVGNDKFELGSGNNTADGGAGNDTLIGNTGNDKLMGGTGNDTLMSSGNTSPPSAGGNDTLDGGAGADTYILGTSIDTIIVETTDTALPNRDIATGFLVGTDKLEFGGPAGTAANFAIATGIAASYTDALELGNGLLNGTVIYAVVRESFGNNNAFVPVSYDVFYDSNADGTADMVIKVSTLGAIAITADDII